MGGSGNGSSFHMARAPTAFPWMNLPATSILQRDSSSPTLWILEVSASPGCHLVRPFCILSSLNRR